MNQQQREQRHAANQAFLEALEQLQAALEKVNGVEARSANQSGSSTGSTSPQFDMRKFEQAAQDIDEFFQHR
jgi:hypothetical protein